MESYPGEIKYRPCPMCGEKVKLTCGQDWKFHGACPSCRKELLE
ncbi:hypothetical protein ES703_40257 [subsurface metagenome]